MQEESQPNVTEFILERLDPSFWEKRKEFILDTNNRKRGRPEDIKDTSKEALEKIFDKHISKNRAKAENNQRSDAKIASIGRCTK